MECFECGRKGELNAQGLPPVRVDFQEGEDKAISGAIARDFCSAGCAAEHLLNVVEDNAVVDTRKASRR
jgi:hypothetical protein